MRDCPQCFAFVDGMVCPSCGFRDAAAPRAGDPLRYLCVYDDRGLRCGQLGTITPNTAGDSKGGPHPGPWYCHEHYPAFRNWGKSEGKPPPDGFRKLRDLLRGHHVNDSGNVHATRPQSHDPPPH